MNFSKKQVDTALPSEQADSTPKASLDTTSSPEKADAGAKEPVVAPKEEAQAKPESKKETEDALKPATNPAPTVSGQDREAMKLSQQQLQLKCKRRSRQH